MSNGLHIALLAAFSIASVFFMFYMLRSLIKVSQEHPGLFNFRKIPSLLKLFGPMLMYMSILLLFVGTLTLRNYQPVAPEPATDAVAAGETLEMPRTKNFERLIWAEGTNLDRTAVACEEVSNNPNFDGKEVAVKAPEGWDTDVTLTLDGKKFFLLTQTDVFNGTTIKCSGGGLETYLATPDPDIQTYRAIGWGAIIASPFVFIAGTVILIATKRSRR